MALRNGSAPKLNVMSSQSSIWAPRCPRISEITYDCAQMLTFQAGQERSRGQTWVSGWPSYSCYDVESTLWRPGIELSKAGMVGHVQRAAHGLICVCNPTGGAWGPAPLQFRAALLLIQYCNSICQMPRLRPCEFYCHSNPDITLVWCFEEPKFACATEAFSPPPTLECLLRSTVQARP
jgi:hypothetical protein